MRNEILTTLKRCALELSSHIMKNADYGYAEDALQSIEEAIESLQKDTDVEEIQ